MAASAWVVSTLLPAAAATPSAPSTVPLFSDTFANDTSLNTSAWQVNGTVAAAFSAVNCRGCTLVTLDPSFSAAGMEIAQVNASSEVGAIQSIESFPPPFTATAVVKGAVSNGHPFVFGMASANSTSGVQVTGNLNPDDCSHEANCGDPSTCGVPANSSIAPDQCFYGIYARTGTTNGTWPKSPMLNDSPSVGVVYTLQIAVAGSGVTQFSVSAAGILLGSSTAQVGAGPFYIIVAQSEGAPVPGPGPNQAYWISLHVTYGATIATPGPSSSSSYGWLAIVIVAVIVVLLVVVLATRRRRGFSVRVLDGGSLSPVSGAGVSADGPRNFSGSTGSDGRIVFGGAGAGEYTVRAGATGYVDAAPTVVPVKGTTAHTVRLARAPPVPPAGEVRLGAPPIPTPPPSAPGVSAPPELRAPPTAAEVPRETGPSPVAPPEFDGGEGWAGERVREIIATFRAKGAVSPETALSAEELGLSRMFVRIMKRRRGRTRVFVEVGGKYYLDERALPQMK